MWSPALHLSVSSFLVVYFKIIWHRTEFMGDLSFQEATRSHSNLRLSSLARYPLIRNPRTGSYDRYDGNLIPVTAKHSNAKFLNTLGWQRYRTWLQSRLMSMTCVQRLLYDWLVRCKQDSYLTVGVSTPNSILKETKLELLVSLEKTWFCPPSACFINCLERSG